MTISRRIIWIILSSILLSSMFGTGSTDAQGPDQEWTGPYRLSSDEGMYMHESNEIISDEYGYVHVVWFEEGFPDDRTVIQYARFDGDTWSTPVDVYTTKPGGVANRLSATIDQDGTLHLIWTEGIGYRNRPIYYMRGPARDALSAQHWTAPVRIDVPAHLIKVQVDSTGVIHILYSKYHEPQPGIYYLRSEGQGISWSDPIWFDPDVLPGYAPASLQFILDEADGLHAVWHYDSADEAADWVRYSNSLDEGNTWSLPFTIDQNDEGSDKLRAAGPILTIQDQSVHVIWGAQLDSGIVRYHRFSTDRGQNWSVSRHVFGHLNGQAGESLITDGAGRVHFFGQIRYPQGVWHAYWDRDHWVGPSLIYMIARDSTEPIGERIHAHSVHAAVRSGNQLVTTFYDRSKERPFALYAMHRTLDDIPPLPTQSMPVPTSTPTPITPPTPTATPFTPTPTITTRNFDPGAVSSSSDSIPRPDSALWVAVIPVLLLVGGIFAFQLLKRR